MSPSNQNLLALVGRVLIALIFVTSGFGKIGGFDGTVGYIASKGMPMPQVMAALAILIELVGGLMVIVGFYTRWAALAIALFCLVSAFVFHNYWAVPEAQKMMQSISFWKNVSIAGGALVLAAFGPGAWSLDGRRTR